jgi:tyrosyl-tRNA synthetase
MSDTVLTLCKNCVSVVSSDALQQKIALNRPLRVKVGFDPTSPDLHLGHFLLIQQLRKFQCLGHIVVCVLGTFTACIGDPSGRNTTRPMLSFDTVSRHAVTFEQQLLHYLDPQQTEIVYNHHWLNDLSMQEIFRMTSHCTVSHLLDRDDFSKRFQQQHTIGLHELLYPVLMAYDSVTLKADIELGGTDQWFNLLMGRTLQRAYGQVPQIVMTLPLIEGLDGVQKMSKSLNNTIALKDLPNTMYGKIMSMNDVWMLKVFPLFVTEPPDSHPMIAKQTLAKAVVTACYTSSIAEEAACYFKDVYINKQYEHLHTHVLPASDDVVSVLKQLQWVRSTSEALRMIRQGSVSCNHTIIEDTRYQLPIGTSLLCMGRRRLYVVILHT